VLPLLYKYAVFMSVAVKKVPWLLTDIMLTSPDALTTATTRLTVEGGTTLTTVEADCELVPTAEPAAAS